MTVAETDEISPAEFAILRRLLANEQTADDDAGLQRLTSRRFVRRSENGWVVTVQGHAAFLHELRKSFDREPPSGK